VSVDASSMTPISTTFLSSTMCKRGNNARSVAAKADGGEIVRTDGTATPAEPRVSQVYRESAGSSELVFEQMELSLIAGLRQAI
jgi:hypothetical protein